MSDIIKRLATSEPTVCAVCRRRAVWLGYRPRHHGPILWLCDNSQCHAAARKIHALAQGALDAYEIGAVLEAGTEAGQYLEKVGKTDLAALSDGEWREFLRRIVVGYEHALRRKILGNEAPF